MAAAQGCMWVMHFGIVLYENTVIILRNSIDYAFLAMTMKFYDLFNFWILINS